MVKTVSDCQTMKCICAPEEVIKKVLPWLKTCVRSNSEDILRGCGEDTH